MKALELNNVRFKYRDFQNWGLGSVSLEVEKGECVTMLGCNGSGKSTLCLLTNGLIPHAIQGNLQGSVSVFGNNVGEQPVSQSATKVGIVFQEPESQLFCMSVEEEVAFGPENLAVPREEIKNRVEWALDLGGVKG